MQVRFVDERGESRLVDFELLTGCRYSPSLTFERSADYRARSCWAMPPPCSPSQPFGGIPSATAAGCAVEMLSQTWPLLEKIVVRRIGAIDGLGLFAADGALDCAGLAVCEYSGELRVDVPPAELSEDDFCFALPVCDPDVVVSARRIGGLARLINHGESPNVELRTVHDAEGVLRVVVLTTRAIAPGEQLLLHYGSAYWRNARRAAIKRSLDPG